MALEITGRAYFIGRNETRVEQTDIDVLSLQEHISTDSVNMSRIANIHPGHPEEFAWIQYDAGYDYVLFVFSQAFSQLGDRVDMAMGMACTVDEVLSAKGQVRCLIYTNGNGMPPAI